MNNLDHIHETLACLWNILDTNSKKDAVGRKLPQPLFDRSLLGSCFYASVDVPTGKAMFMLILEVLALSSRSRKIG